MKLEPGWKPEVPSVFSRPPCLASTPSEIWVAVGSLSVATPKLVFCAMAMILPVPGSTDTSTALTFDSSPVGT